MQSSWGEKVVINRGLYVIYGEIRHNNRPQAYLYFLGHRGNLSYGLAPTMSLSHFHWKSIKTSVSHTHKTPN